MTYRHGPRDFGGLIRSLSDRVRTMEQRRLVSVGEWSLEQNDFGHLVAVHKPTGETRVLATVIYDPADEGES